MPKLSPDKPGIVKRVDSLETQVGRLEDVRDNMMENVGETQYIHAPRHANGGDDPLYPSDIGAANKVHSHSYTDITNLQEMINAFPGFDLNGLVSALVPLIKPWIVGDGEGGGFLNSSGAYGSEGAGGVGGKVNYCGSIYSPVRGTLKRIVFSCHSTSGNCYAVGVGVNSVLVKEFSGRLENGIEDLSVPVKAGDIISLALRISYAGGGEDAYRSGSFNYSVFIS